MLKTRVLTAAIALPAVLAAILFLPNWLFSLVIGLLGVWGLHEVGTITGARSRESMLLLAVGGGLPLVLLFLADDIFWLLPTTVIAAMLALVAAVAARGSDAGPRGQTLTLLGAIYVGALFPYFALVRNRPGGVVRLILMLLIVIATDSAAYFGGRQFGRHKLAFKVSPQKTVEGAVAGVMGAVVTGLILRPSVMPQWSLVKAVTFAMVVSILAALGDLAGSALKRVGGVKDSGWIFPGHGGLLDRTCSLVFATVFTYYYTR